MRRRRLKHDDVDTEPSCSGSCREGEGVAIAALKSAQGQRTSPRCVSRSLALLGAS